MPADARTVRANVPGSAYDIVVQPGLLARAGEALRGLSTSSRVALVTDTEVGPRFLGKLEASLRGEGFDVISATVPAGEEHKTIQTIASVYDQLFTKTMERAT